MKWAVKPSICPNHALPVSRARIVTAVRVKVGQVKANPVPNKTPRQLMRVHPRRVKVKRVLRASQIKTSRVRVPGIVAIVTVDVAVAIVIPINRPKGIVNHDDHRQPIPHS